MKKKLQKQIKKVYIKTYIKPDGSSIVLRSDKVPLEKMHPRLVREKYNIPRFVEVKETVEITEEE